MRSRLAELEPADRRGGHAAGTFAKLSPRPTQGLPTRAKPGRRRDIRLHTHDYLTLVDMGLTGCGVTIRRLGISGFGDSRRSAVDHSRMEPDGLPYAHRRQVSVAAPSVDRFRGNGEDARDLQGGEKRNGVSRRCV
jgi:hypothetical protein